MVCKQSILNSPTYVNFQKTLINIPVFRIIFKEHVEKYSNVLLRVLECLERINLHRATNGSQTLTLFFLPDHLNSKIERKGSKAVRAVLPGNPNNYLV